MSQAMIVACVAVLFVLSACGGERTFTAPILPQDLAIAWEKNETLICERPNQPTLLQESHWRNDAGRYLVRFFKDGELVVQYEGIPSKFNPPYVDIKTVAAKSVFGYWVSYGPGETAEVDYYFRDATGIAPYDFNKCAQPLTSS